MHRYVLAFLIVASPFSALAGELPKEGTYDYIACSPRVNNLAFSKAYTASSYEQMGVVLSNPPGGMFDKNTFRCVGTNAAFDGKNTAYSVCETIDVDGDKRLSYFSTADGKTTRTSVAGTGK
jgi:hypothetical protein